jgi:hypothetical protein
MRSAAARDVTDGDVMAKALVVVVESLQVTTIDRSGEIETGGVAQNFMPANQERQGWIIQNYSTSPLYISGLGTASPNGDSLMIPGVVGAGYIAEFVSGAALSIFGAVSGQKFYAREW